jgi:hypothetical protein
MERLITGHANVEKHAIAQPRQAVALLMKAKQGSKLQCCTLPTRGRSDGGFDSRCHFTALLFVAATSGAFQGLLSSVCGSIFGLPAVSGIGTRRKSLSVEQYYAARSTVTGTGRQIVLHTGECACAKLMRSSSASSEQSASTRIFTRMSR